MWVRIFPVMVRLGGCVQLYEIDVYNIIYSIFTTKLLSSGIQAEISTYTKRLKDDKIR